MTADPIVENAASSATEVLGLIAHAPPSRVRDVALAAIILRCRRDALAKGTRPALIDAYLAEVVRQVVARLAVIDATGRGTA